jgi:valyl-tRNA synthetase
MEIEKVYEPQRFEPHWAQWWIDSGIFQAHADSPAPMFSIVIPPPNVTGSLHMGHMLDHTEIDITTRWHRMRGFNTLWLPGTDHAGIATQMVVERELAKEGLSRLGLGREEFERRVWAWKEQYGDRIKRQMIRMGTSCDWSRERFTLDPGLSRAVREAFARLYEKGLIYRGAYMVNWCPRCHTAISDLETVHEDSQGSLWHIRYPLTGAGKFLTIATTRPETMLGDTAVAVNPNDERYKDLHGRTVTLPLMNREIPIILDELADPKFGTGVVKVTPAHDPNDFEAGKRHNLPHVKVIGEDAKMTQDAGAYAGLDRFEARKLVVADLEKLGLLEKTEPYTLPLGKCQRCKTIVEPLVSTQWFVKMKPLAEPAIEAVKDGRIRIIPENWQKIYFDWMYNIRDWCISRQLWWGHRIPAWHCEDCKEITVARETPSKCSRCGSDRIVQDPDVLDTWFSSGLWPFSTLGWPEQTKDLATFYPTTLLITGFDIIFFWVARMIVMGLEMMGDVPFRTVFMHGLVRDADRQKMSKTRGNVVDPLQLTEQYGTDAVRFGLVRGAAAGADIALTEDRFLASRNFANKIWNSARLLFMNQERVGKAEPLVELPVVDRWILSRLNRTAAEVNRAIEQYRFHEAAELLYHFFWDEYCDWYLEMKKPAFESGEGAAHLATAFRVFESALRMLHPVMPFITEETWQRLELPDKPVSIAIAAYPECDLAAIDEAAEREIGIVQDIVTSVRNTRADNKLDPKAPIEGTIYSNPGTASLVAGHLDFIQRIGRAKLDLQQENGAADFRMSFRIPLARERVQKEIEQLEKAIANSKRQLSDEKFLRRAPAHVVQGIRSKLSEYQAQLDKNRSALNG